MKKGFPKLSSFEEDENNRHKTAVTYRAEITSIRRKPAFSRVKFPSVFRLLKISLVPNKFILFLIVLAILLIGFFLPIDLPFSKQKSPSFRSSRLQIEPQEIRKEPILQRGSRLPNELPQEIGKEPPVQDLPPQISVSQATSTQEKTNSSKKGVKVIGNSDSKRYHLPGMKYYDKVRANHRVIFQSEEEAINAGYHKAR